MFHIDLFSILLSVESLFLTQLSSRVFNSYLLTEIIIISLVIWTWALKGSFETYQLIIFCHRHS